MEQASGHGQTGRLDIVEGVGQGNPVDPGVRGARPWIQVWFACAGRYQRVFRPIDGTAYVARCPQCGKTMRFAVGEGGTSKRMFTVSC